MSNERQRRSTMGNGPVSPTWMSGVRRCNGRKRPSDRSQALSRKRVSQGKAVVRGATMGVIGGKMLTKADVTAAIADLAKAGMAFTTHIGSHGKKIYIIDSVALAEDELAMLSGSTPNPESRTSFQRSVSSGRPIHSRYTRSRAGQTCFTT